MGLFDKAKDAAADHADKIDGAIDKAAKMADDRLDEKHDSKIAGAADKAHDGLDRLTGGDRTPKE